MVEDEVVNKKTNEEWIFLLFTVVCFNIVVSFLCSSLCIKVQVLFDVRSVCLCGCGPLFFADQAASVPLENPVPNYFCAYCGVDFCWAYIWWGWVSWLNIKGGMEGLC